MTRQRYLLDTCICASILRDKFGVKERVKAIGIENCCISEMTMAELKYGKDDFKNIKDIQIENWIDRSK